MNTNEALRNVDLTFRNVADSISDDRIKEIANAFINNLNRALNLRAALVDVAYFSGMLGECRGQAVAQVCKISGLDFGGALGSGDSGAFAFEFKKPEEITPNQQYLINAATRIFFNSMAEKEPNETWVIGTMMIETLNEIPYINDAMRGIMDSMILASWTAFEVLAGDIWEEIVNRGPSTIAATLASSGEWKNEKKLSIRDLHKFKSDFRSETGSFYRETGQANFQTLESIKFCYSVALGKKVLEIFDTIEAGRITVLAAVRNIITHKSGIVDASFLRQVDAFAGYNTWPEKVVFPNSNLIVLTLFSASSLVGQALIKKAIDTIHSS